MAEKVFFQPQNTNYYYRFHLPGCLSHFQACLSACYFFFFSSSLRFLISTVFICSVFSHTFLAVLYIAFLEGAGMLLSKQSLLTLLGPIDVCVRETLRPTLAVAAFLPSCQYKFLYTNQLTLKCTTPHTTCLKCFPWCYYTTIRQAIPMARSYQYRWLCKISSKYSLEFTLSIMLFRPWDVSA